jgi:hypothetical protein
LSNLLCSGSGAGSAHWQEQEKNDDPWAQNPLPFAATAADDNVDHRRLLVLVLSLLLLLLQVLWKNHCELLQGLWT